MMIDFKKLLIVSLVIMICICCENLSIGKKEVELNTLPESIIGNWEKIPTKLYQGEEYLPRIRYEIDQNEIRYREIKDGVIDEDMSIEWKLLRKTTVGNKVIIYTDTSRYSTSYILQFDKDEYLRIYEKNIYGFQGGTALVDDKLKGKFMKR
ncbi:MAG: hypothetical protein R2828_34215 [Saprospiraceae bacterium]